jgi:uncharacterized protein (TIGR02246 family)
MRVMKWLWTLAVAAMLAVTPHGDAQASPAKADATEIRAVLSGIQAAWNHHDMTAFVSYMTEDVEWVNVVGMCWRGKAQVFLAHDRMHKTTFRDRQWYDAEMTELRQVAPGVVIVTEAVPMDGYASQDGGKTPSNRNMLTLVFVHRNGRWLVAEGHNTIIDPAAAAHDPGK